MTGTNTSVKKNNNEVNPQYLQKNEEKIRWNLWYISLPDRFFEINVLVDAQKKFQKFQVML